MAGSAWQDSSVGCSERMLAEIMWEINAYNLSRRKGIVVISELLVDKLSDCRLGTDRHKLSPY